MAVGKDQAAQEQAVREGEIETSVALGFTAAVAALGLFLIPAIVAISIGVTGLPRTAMIVFGIFYASCLLVTWRCYFCKKADICC